VAPKCCGDLALRPGDRETERRRTNMSDYEDGDWGGWDTDTADEQGNLPGGD
jgi:hypothetical protein